MAGPPYGRLGNQILSLVKLIYHHFYRSRFEGLEITVSARDQELYFQRSPFHFPILVESPFSSHEKKEKEGGGLRSYREVIHLEFREHLDSLPKEGSYTTTTSSKQRRTRHRNLPKKWHQCFQMNHDRMIQTRCFSNFLVLLFPHLFTREALSSFCDPPHRSIVHSQNTLTVHSRSGDIAQMCPSGHGYYLFPPLLVVCICKDFHLDHIHIVAENDDFDWVHDVVRLAHDHHLRTSVQSIDVWQDWCTLANANNILIDCSTFTSSSVLFNSHVDRVFQVDFFQPFMSTDCAFEIVNYSIDDTAGIYSQQWFYSPKRRQELLRHFPSFQYFSHQKSFSYRKPNMYGILYPY